MKKWLIIPMLAASFAIISCEEDSSIIRTDGPAVDEREDSVLANCEAVLAAVDVFAAENRGNYPEDVASDLSEGGHTLVDLLPGGALVVNPFTGEATEPVDGRAAHPGEIGYEPLLRGYYFNRGYTITGFGAEAVIVELSNIPALEDSVVANCYLVRDAAEEFAAVNDGVYPQDVDVDTTPSGNTLVDLLPGGTYLENPFTGAPSEPVNREAGATGETGYQPIIGVHPVHGPGVCVGYSITGVGGVPGEHILVIEHRIDE